MSLRGRHEGHNKRDARSQHRSGQGRQRDVNGALPAVGTIDSRRLVQAWIDARERRQENHRAVAELLPHVCADEDLAEVPGS